MRMCAACKAELPVSPTQDLVEMEKEYNKNWPGKSMEETELVCDDCFRIMEKTLPFRMIQ